MACWSTKAAISLKRAKIKEKLLWRAYRNSPTLFQTVLFQTLRPKIIRLPPSIPGMGKAMDFKFGRYMYRVHLNKKSIKKLEKRERGRILGLTELLGYSIHTIDRKKTH